MSDIKIYQKLKSDYKKILNAKKRIEKSLIYKIDKEKTYEWLFLYSVTIFENYLESIFVQILKNNIKWKRGTWIKLNPNFIISTKASNKDIKKFILWEKRGDYLDWIPYKNTTEERSKRYFECKNPFILPDQKIQLLNQIVSLRNYIAHRSKESKNKLEANLSFKLLSINHLFTKKISWRNEYFDHYIFELNSISWLIQKDLIE